MDHGRADAEILLRRLPRGVMVSLPISAGRYHKTASSGMQESVQHFVVACRVSNRRNICPARVCGNWARICFSSARLFYKARIFTGWCGGGIKALTFRQNTKTRCWLCSENAPAPCAMVIRCAALVYGVTFQYARRVHCHASMAFASLNNNTTLSEAEKQSVGRSGMIVALWFQ